MLIKAGLYITVKQIQQEMNVILGGLKMIYHANSAQVTVQIAQEPNSLVTILALETQACLISAFLEMTMGSFVFAIFLGTMTLMIL